jgi:hypothetical protein
VNVAYDSGRAQLVWEFTNRKDLRAALSNGAECEAGFANGRVAHAQGRRGRTEAASGYAVPFGTEIVIDIRRPWRICRYFSVCSSRAGPPAARPVVAKVLA